MGKYLNKYDLQLVQPNERLFTFVVQQMLSIGRLQHAESSKATIHVETAPLLIKIK
jgi:hypothetical protein